MPELQAKLGGYGISADRRAIYEDIEALNNTGWDVLREETGKRGYFMASRDIDDAEISLLIDSVRTYRFLPQHQSEHLAEKLLRLGAPTFRNEFLSRKKPLVFGKKGGNTRVLYTVDRLLNAIAQARKTSISFISFGERQPKCTVMRR